MPQQALVARLFVRTNLLLKLGYLVSVLYVYSWTPLRMGKTVGDNFAAAKFRDAHNINSYGRPM